MLFLLLSQPGYRKVGKSMLKGLYIAHTGMVHEQKRMDIMTNNLANASTVGYKREGSTSQTFDAILTDKIKDASVGTETVQALGYNHPGVKIGENYTDFSQGSFRVTGNTLDLALSGEGFFAVEFTNKAGETTTLYTRAGQLALNKDGDLVNRDGDYILDTRNQHIRLDTLEDLAIDKAGIIYQDGEAVAQIQVADFQDYDYLEKYGETLYRPIEGAELTESYAEVYSGHLEMSNISTVTEMVNLISITRAYEANQKIIQTYDQSLEIATGQLGKLQ